MVGALKQLEARGGTANLVLVQIETSVGEIAVGMMTFAVSWWNETVSAFAAMHSDATAPQRIALSSLQKHLGHAGEPFATMIGTATALFDLYRPSIIDIKAFKGTYWKPCHYLFAPL